MIDQAKINELLRGIGKGTFIACYSVVEQNYNGNRNVIKKVIAEYGLKTTGQNYTQNVIESKTSKSCTIFKNGWEKEALAMCGEQDFRPAENKASVQSHKSPLIEIQAPIKTPVKSYRSKKDKHYRAFRPLKNK